MTGAARRRPADGRHRPALVVGDEAEGIEIAPSQLPDCGKRPGSSSEVYGFRVQVEHRLLVEAFTSGRAALDIMFYDPQSSTAVPFTNWPRTIRIWGLTEAVGPAVRTRLSVQCPDLRQTPGEGTPRIRDLP